jgi:hypothetical protein
MPGEQRREFGLAIRCSVSTLQSMPEIQMP